MFKWKKEDKYYEICQFLNDFKYIPQNCGKNKI